jgi:hypothetical protein|tara:strand:- start:165 stop:362 length:198 start_codon:yes stop_codon:yes gene_type:complete
MYKTNNAQSRLIIGFNRKDTIETHKNNNPIWYDKTEMMFSGKIKALKGGLKKGTKAKEKEIFTSS